MQLYSVHVDFHSEAHMWHDKNMHAVKYTVQISTHNAAQLFGQFG